MILSDNETKVDLLNSEAIASTIVKLVTERPDHPITIGVHGDWGAGKSSVLEMIESGLSDDDDILVIKFNGWRFQGFEDAKISLIEGIVNELIEKKSLLTKATDEVKDIFKRIDWLKLAKRAGSLAVTAFTGIPSPEIIQNVIGGLEKIARDPGKVATAENIGYLLTEAKSLLKPKEDSKNVPEEIGEFRKSFDKLLKKAGIKQLIVLVDDLDRCLPETAIETLEAIRLFVFTTKTAFVIAADEMMIEYSVRQHFPNFEESTLTQSYARNYLEKLIQVPFRIPILGETETRIYVTLLLIGSELGDNDTDFTKLINLARERLKKPWESKPLESGDIRTTLGAKAGTVQNMLLLSDQIGPVLAKGTRGNPRQIKRFLNTLLLRQRTAEARGFGQLINLQILAKLMIAERFMPRFFEQIATLSAMSPSGACKEISNFLDSLETKSSTSNKQTSNAGSLKNKGSEEVRKKPAEEGDFPTEWKSSSEFENWIQMEPSLRDVDLRPYIFISKDRTDYFGVTSNLGHLAELADKLSGSKMVVQMHAQQVQQLPPSDARKLFDALREKLISVSSLDKQPDGIEGMMLIVKHHTVLQPEILDFLEGLPKDKLGAWVLRGWDSVIIEAQQKQRFNALIDEWEKKGSPFLKTAAASVKKIGKK